MSAKQKLQKLIVSFSKNHSGISEEEMAECSALLLTSAIAFTSRHRVRDDLESEVQLDKGLRWLMMSFAGDEVNLQGCTELTMVLLVQIHLKVERGQMSLVNAIEAFSVLLTGLVLIGSTTQDTSKMMAQSEAISAAIQKTAFAELAMVHSPLGEMN